MVVTWNFWLVLWKVQDIFSEIYLIFLSTIDLLHLSNHSSWSIVWASYSRMPACVPAKSPSRVRLFTTSWTVAYHAALFIGFFRQEYWWFTTFPLLGDHPDPGINPHFLPILHWQVGLFGVDAVYLLQGIFLNPGIEPRSHHCKRIFYQLSHKWKPKNIWVGSLSLLQDFPDPGVKLGLPSLQVDSLPTELMREAL